MISSKKVSCGDLENNKKSNRLFLRFLQNICHNTFDKLIELVLSDDTCVWWEDTFKT